MSKYHRVFSLVSECPKCKCRSTVWDTRMDDNAIGLIRKRKCPQCNLHWKTIELNCDEFMEAYNAGKFD